MRLPSTPAGAPWRWCDSSWSSAATGSASLSTARPDTTHRPTGRWASACSTRSRWRCPLRTGRPRLDAGGDHRLGRAPRQRNPGHLLELRRGAVRLPSTRCRCTRAAASPARSARGPARVSPSTCRSRPAPATTPIITRLESEIIPRVRQFTPDLVLVSAGFDAHAADPLAACRVTEVGFAEMARRVQDNADEFQVPLGLVLEGGYDPDALAASVIATMVALGDLRAGSAGQAPAGLLHQGGDGPPPDPGSPRGPRRPWPMRRSGSGPRRSATDP